MQKLYNVTDQIQSTPLSQLLGYPVDLKMENQQPSGSFKNRGIGNICSKLAQQGIKQFISCSGGNGGLAVAYSGKQLKIPVKIVLPASALPMMIEKISSEGAEVIVQGKDFYEAEQYAITLLNDETRYISPFDHPLIWEGHSTLIDEVYKTGKKPGAIVVAVGGGGLFTGIIEGLHKVGWSDIPVIAVETEGAASLAASMNAGQLVTLNEIKTIATSLGARKVAQKAFEWSQKHKVYSEIVTDLEAVNACIKFVEDHQTLVEPACGAALAIAYHKREILKKFSSVLIVVCGGNAVSPLMLNNWKKSLEQK